MESGKGLLRMGMFCVIGGLCFLVTGMANGHLVWSYVVGVITVAALLPVVRCGPRSMVVQAAIMALMLVVIGIVCTISEGALFYPETAKALTKTLVGGTMVYLGIACVLALLARVMKVSGGPDMAIGHRGIAGALGMLLLSGVAYVLYYGVFGAITFQVYTKQFYPHAAEQVGALGGWFWVYQLGRGVLMAAAILPVIYALRLPRWQAAVATGLMVWIVGGGAALLIPNEMMVAQQRYAHIVEIFTQNFSLGVTALLLLRRKAKVAASSAEPVRVS